jgi:hypothetical protein
MTPCGANFRANVGLRSEVRRIKGAVLLRGIKGRAATRLDTRSTDRHASPNLSTLGASEQACMIFAGIVPETSCVLAQCLHRQSERPFSRKFMEEPRDAQR